MDIRASTAYFRLVQDVYTRERRKLSFCGGPLWPDSLHCSIVARAFTVASRCIAVAACTIAPSVLASIYKDMGLLKATILSATEVETSEGYDEVLAVTLWSPMHLVQP